MNRVLVTGCIQNSHDLDFCSFRQCGNHLRTGHNGLFWHDRQLLLDMFQWELILEGSSIARCIDTGFAYTVCTLGFGRGGDCDTHQEHIITYGGRVLYLLLAIV
jgi:hypothetical protein